MLIPRRLKHRKQHHPGRSGAATGGTVISFGDYGINIYPDRPLTKKPAETRMGSGKGSPEWWIANVKPGRVMFELAGVPEPLAREAMRRAQHKLPMKTRFVVREGGGN